MKFKMNERTWEITEAPGDWLLEEYKKELGPNSTFCFGLTRYHNQMIYINSEMCEDVKRQTLMHELMHCYMWNYLSNYNEWGEEAVCDICANSHDIIHKIAEDYFKGKQN